MAMSGKLSKIKSAKQLDYYTKDNAHEAGLEIGSYYGKDGTLEQSGERMLSGRWYDPHGLTKKELNNQIISAPDFQQILRGRDPVSGEALVRNADAENRTMGIDVTLSPPKPFTLLWVGADEAKKRIIEKIQHDAALAAVKFADENLVVTRRGAGGAVEEKAHGIYALFDHKTARPHENLVAPQLHTHCIFSGMVRAADDSMLALQEKKMMNWRSALENVYHAELANGLKKLGYEIEVTPGKTAFQIRGMEKFQDACEALSPRSRQIKQVVEEKFEGRDRRDLTRSEDQIAVMHNRASKLELSRAELDRSWEAAVKASGTSLDDLRNFMREVEQSPKKIVEPFRLEQKELAEFREQIAAELHEQDSVFKEGVLYGKVAFALQGKACREEIDQVFAAVKGGLVEIGTDGQNNKLYASETQIALERRMVEMAKQATPQHVMDRDYVESLIAERQTPELKAAGKAMTSGQGNAAFEVLCGNLSARRVSIIEAPAGAGKSYLSELLRTAWEGNVDKDGKGMTVHGLCLGWKQSQVLAAECKLEYARAIAGWINDAEKGKLEPALNSRSVLLIDEAGLIDSKSMARIISIAEKTDAKVVLMGDTRQLSPIGGAAMTTLCNELNSVRFGDSAPEIRRQKTQWMAQAGLDIAQSKAKDAVNAYREAGSFQISKNRDESIDALVAAVRTHRQEHPEQSHMVIANNRSDVRELNERLRTMKRDIGEITGPDVEILCGDGDDTRYKANFSVGETIQFRNNGRRDENVFNRTQAKIVEIDQSGDAPVFHVELENGKRTSFSPVAGDPTYNDKTGVLCIEPAHCQTTFSAQGGTVDQTFCMDAANFDRRQAYICMSRHRLNVSVFLDKESEAERIVTPDNWRHPNSLTEDEIYADVSSRWSRSQDKLTTYDLLKNSAYDLSKADELKEAERIALLDENARIVEMAQSRLTADRIYREFQEREAARIQKEIERNPDTLIFNPVPEYSYEQYRAAKRVALYQSDLDATERDTAPLSGAGVLDMSRLELVQHAQRLDDLHGPEVLLPQDAHDQLGQEGDTDLALRRTGTRDPRAGSEAGVTETHDVDFSSVTIFEPPQARPDLRARLSSAPIIFAASEESAYEIAERELSANEPATVVVVEDAEDTALLYPAVREAVQSADRPIYFAGDINRSTANRIMQIATEHPASADKTESHYRDLVRQRDHDREHTI